MNIRVENNLNRLESYNTNLQAKTNANLESGKVKEVENTNKVNKLKRETTKGSKDIKTITKEIRDRVLLLGKNDRSIHVIASELSISTDMVKSILSANGIKESKKDNPVTLDDKTLIKLKSSGLSFSEMAKLLNTDGIAVTSKEIKQKCVDLGIKEINRKA